MNLDFNLENKFSTRQTDSRLYSLLVRFKLIRQNKSIYSEYKSKMNKNVGGVTVPLSSFLNVKVGDL